MELFLKYVQSGVSDADWDNVLRACIDVYAEVDDQKAADRMIKMMKVQLRISLVPWLMAGTDLCHAPSPCHDSSRPTRSTRTLPATS